MFFGVKWYHVQNKNNIQMYMLIKWIEMLYKNPGIIDAFPHIMSSSFMGNER